MCSPAMANFEIKHPFRSTRLVYRAFEDTGDDRKWYDEMIWKDALAFPLNSGNLLRPQNRKLSDKAFDSYLEDALAVFICLPRSSDATANVEDGETAHTTTKDTPENRSNLEHIGVLTLDGGSDEDFQHRNMFLTITVTERYRNQGFGREALDWAVDWAFRQAGMHSVALNTVEYNRRARHLYESVGFALEGRHRQGHYFDRQWWDIVLYSMLEHEWEALRGLRREDRGRVGALDP